jgi:hypothetical protein
VRTHRVSGMLRILFLFSLLSPSVISSQMPPSLGKLHITSNPPGAHITINNVPRSEVTNVTLVVSPGVYTVSITGNHLSCSQQCKVSSGQTFEVSCASNSTTNSASAKDHGAGDRSKGDCLLCGLWGADETHPNKTPGGIWERLLPR